MLLWGVLEKFGSCNSIQSKKKSIKRWEGFIPKKKKSGREKKGKWGCSKKWKQNFVSKNRFH
jgi:hypothetical protein